MAKMDSHEKNQPDLLKPQPILVPFSKFLDYLKSCQVAGVRPETVTWKKEGHYLLTGLRMPRPTNATPPS